MNKKALYIIIYNIIVVLSVMYATQPLQPLLSKEFNISIPFWKDSLARCLKVLGERK